jgi:hypothetical protein
MELLQQQATTTAAEDLAVTQVEPTAGMADKEAEGLPSDTAVLTF